MGTEPSAPLFRGVGVALITLFDEEGRPQIEATVEHAATLVDLDVKAVVLSGTTGEPWFLSESDRVALIAGCREALPPDVPVVAGTGHFDLDVARRMTSAARDAGADAALVLSMPQADDQRPYYSAVADAAKGLPLLAYHLPVLSMPGVPLDQLPDLPVRGMKDSSGDAERLAQEIDGYDGELYVGSSAILSLAGPLGVDGAILALANVEPERCAEAFAGDSEVQRSLLRSHLDAFESFPAGLKKAVSKRFGTSLAVGSVMPPEQSVDGDPE